MTFIDFVFFAYMFIGLYMLMLLISIYVKARKEMFFSPPAQLVPVSIIVPCYNAESTIGVALDSLLALDYPKELLEIIVVDDRSKDNSTAIVRNYASKHSIIRLIVNKRNSGGAAEPTNIGVKAARYDFVAVTDDDSAPEPGALKKMIGFLQRNDTTAAVTCAVLARSRTTFMQKLQAIEYTSIAWSRKLLDAVDSVYVTPGPFALYDRNILLKVGLFDTKNMTQDIEIVWRLLSRGYKARMCLAARVYSETPKTFKKWFKQRVRWNIGGTQTLLKYRNLVFKRGMLGVFIIPYFSLSLFLGLFGLGMFFYLMGRRIAVSYISTHYSLAAHTTILRLSELSFSPSILNFFGAVLFLLGVTFTILGLGIMRERLLHYRNIFNILFYMLVYLTIYPFIMIAGMYKLVRGTYSW
jgi:cellulose synthase/poly-beta-1,6-N-acetylglucosamine synthase-like glycosyltransferase